MYDNRNTGTKTTTRIKLGRLANLLGRALFCACLFLAVYQPAHSQTFRGGVSGTVVDASGAALPGTTVKLTNKATAAVRTVETGKDGEFLATELPLGFYTVEVAKPGF